MFDSVLFRRSPNGVMIDTGLISVADDPTVGCSCNGALATGLPMVPDCRFHWMWEDSFMYFIGHRLLLGRYSRPKSRRSA